MKNRILAFRKRFGTEIRQWRYSKTFLKRGIYTLAHESRELLLFLTSGRFRSEKLAAWKSKGGYHQRSTLTAPDRYPLLFQQAKLYFMNKADNPNILSFGCSTGEEVFTLGKYLPNAHVVGIDINKWCLRQCWKNNGNPRQYSFLYRFSREFEAAGNFDAIFCLAVFQRTENRTNEDNSISTTYTFGQFEQEITMLDGKLKEGGLFVIDHSDFSFKDAFCSKNYLPLPFENNQLLRYRPLFDRNNQKIAETQNNFRMFVKQSKTGDSLSV